LVMEWEEYYIWRGCQKMNKLHMTIRVALRRPTIVIAITL
jgi:hypothetical protein